MLRSQVVLMAMAAKGRGARFDPVRIQKLLFLIEREVGGHVDGPHFDFQPYLYGPFDKAVYQELDALHGTGTVDIHHEGSQRAYTLTGSGHECGKKALSELAGPVRRYVAEAARWVLSLSFGELLSAIYRHYPDMAVNSIVSEVATRYPGVSHRSPLPSFLSGVGRTLDLAGVLDEHELDRGGQDDARAIYADWCAVGDDLRRAMADFRHPMDDLDVK